MTSRNHPPGTPGGRDQGHTASTPLRRGDARAMLTAGPRAMQHFPAAAAPPPVSVSIPFHGTLNATPGLAASNAACYANAMTLLAQSATGRQLLEDLSRIGYGVVFDDARTTEQDASALCDPFSKMVILRATTDADGLALLLAHEAVHALQNERADDLLPSAHHKPETLFRLAFAIEADAYAQQIQVAYELARLKTKPHMRPLHLMRTRFPVITRAGDRLLAQAGTDAAATLNDGRLVATLFNAFYDDFSLRSYYEASHLDWINGYAARRAPPPAEGESKTRKTFNAKAGLADMFRRDMRNDRLQKLLTWRGMAYVQQHRPDIDFTAPRYAGLSAPTGAGLKQFYADWLPRRRVPTVPTFGLFVVAGGKAPPQVPEPPSDRIAAHTGKNARPIKAPRKRKRDFW